MCPLNAKNLNFQSQYQETELQRIKIRISNSALNNEAHLHHSQRQLAATAR